MASRAGMFKFAGELIEVLERIDKSYFIFAEGDKIYLAEDNEEWSPKLLVWGEED
jgi:hypothetical protein